MESSLGDAKAAEGGPATSLPVMDREAAPYCHGLERAPYNECSYEWSWPRFPHAMTRACQGADLARKSCLRETKGHRALGSLETARSTPTHQPNHSNSFQSVPFNPDQASVNKLGSKGFPFQRVPKRAGGPTFGPKLRPVRRLARGSCSASSALAAADCSALFLALQVLPTKGRRCPQGFGGGFGGGVWRGGFGGGVWRGGLEGGFGGRG